MSIRNMLLATAGAVVAFAANAHAVTYSLSGSVGVSPTFSITSGGTTATFTSTSGNGFTVQSTTGVLPFSPALVDNNFFGTDPLTITFSQPINDEIVIPFAIIDAFSSGGDTLTATLSNGQTRLFNTALDNLALAEPVGIVAIVPTSAITSLTLTSAHAFAISNTTVPEPVSLALLGTGLIGLAVARRRARRD